MNQYFGIRFAILVDLAATKLRSMIRRMLWIMFSFKWWFSFAIDYSFAVGFVDGFFLKYFELLIDNG